MDNCTDYSQEHYLLSNYPLENCIQTLFRLIHFHIVGGTDITYK